MKNKSTETNNNSQPHTNSRQSGWFIFNIIRPKSTDEDSKRREFILNILLFGSIIFSVIVAALVGIYSIRLGDEYKGTPFFITLIIIGVFLFLFFLSRIGFFTVAAYILTFTYLLATANTLYTWGIDLPQGVLSLALIIIMSGILISTRFTFIVTGVISIILLLFSYLHTYSIVSPESYWRNQQPVMGDAIALVATFSIMALVSWLSNREIEKSLQRARTSEEALKKERDLLEVKVEERTRELKRTQLEKMSQLYHFAEFGRLASGLFHDLVNPLTVVSFNLEELNERAQEKRSKALIDMASILQHAIDGTRRMQVFVESVRKQIQQQETKTDFFLEHEVNQVIQLLSFKAKEHSVDIKFSPNISIKTYGDPVKFYKVISNLLSNAIDSYEEQESRENERHKINIDLSQKDTIACIQIQDWGKGISDEHLTRVFEPFFTTKSIEKGTGLGLSICKNIIENDFEGHISVTSKEGQGTTFTIKLPIRKNNND